MEHLHAPAGTPFIASVCGGIPQLVVRTHHNTEHQAWWYLNGTEWLQTDHQDLDYIIPLEETPLDTTELTHKINHLHTAYHHLEEAKYATGQTRDERTMRPGGRLGPQTPGHTKPVNLCLELETRLYDYVCDAKRYITPTRMLPKNWDTMLPWLKFNAEQITTLDPGYVDELALELDYQTRRINRLIQPTAPRTDRPEPWHPARTVITLCAGQGHRVTQGQLRQLAHRGIIETQASGNRNLYRTSQVLQHLKGQHQ